LINIAEILFKQVCTITNNISEYRKKGYSIIYDFENQLLSINYNNSTYIAKIILNDGSLYWQLEPYNNSLFTTKYESEESFNLVLFAIKENDELYKN